jgi:hypothetical protein
MSATVANVFISYRREDAAGHAGRLCDRLTARFGHAQVFMDLQDIAPGQNFARSIDDTIGSCECVVVVIGPRWLDTLQARALGAEDFVRHEIAAALRRSVTIIPVLVGGARMPAAGQLPAEVAALSQRNALEVRDDRFDEDAARLADAVSAHVPVNAGGRLFQSSRARVVAAALGVTVLIGAAAAWRTLSPPTADTAATPESGLGAFHGDWIAEMQKEGQPPFRIRLTFVTVGDTISGMVRYPTGEGPILDPRLAGGMLTFHTAHVPQFEAAPAVIRFQATAGSNEIRLTATDDSGISTGVATRRLSVR